MTDATTYRTPAALPEEMPAERRMRTIILIVLLIAAIFFTYPTIQMLVNSFKSNDGIISNPSGLPDPWTLSSYADGFLGNRGLTRALINSIIISTTSTVIAVALSALAAYGFAKFRFRGRDLIFAALLTTMMVPPEVLIPGQYLIFARLGLIETLTVQIVPTVTPVLGLFLIRQYMLSLPDEIIEAARIDGASEFMIFRKIILPMAAPVLSAYAILHFLSEWNAYLWPSIVATSPEVKPIMVLLPQLVDTEVGFLPVFGTIMAGCVVATLPMVIVFLIFQDKIMNSITLGAVK